MSVGYTWNLIRVSAFPRDSQEISCDGLLVEQLNSGPISHFAQFVRDLLFNQKNILLRV